MVEDEHVLSRVATFYVRYPEPLPFPPDVESIIIYPSPLEGYKGAVGHLAPDGSAIGGIPDEISASLFASITFHQGQMSTSRMAVDISEITDVVRTRMPNANLASITPTSPVNDSWSAYTIAEITTPIVSPARDGIWRPHAPTPDVMGLTMDRALEALFRLIRAYRAATNAPIMAPATPRLGPLAVVRTRTAQFDNGEWDGDPLYMTIVEAIRSRFVMPPTLGAAGFSQIWTYIHAELYDYPLISFKEIQADAGAALFENGDSRSTVLLAHSASEVLLDQALMLMLWEEGKTATEAAVIFAAVLLTRVRAEFHSRIGGEWETRRGTVIGTWREDLVLLRHRVAHAGYRPTPPEASRAIDAHRALLKHLFDRLAASNKKYPKTTALVVGTAGLERRGMKRVARDAIKHLDVATVARFNVWRNDVLAQRFR